MRPTSKYYHAALAAALISGVMLAPAALAQGTVEPAKKAGAKKDGVKKDEAKKDGAKKDGAKKDEAKKDGAKKDGAKKDGAKKDGAKKDGAKKAGTKKTGDAMMRAKARAAHAKLIQAYRMADTKPERCEELALEAIEIFPSYDQARLFLAWFYMTKLGENGKAAEQYDKVLRTSKVKRHRAEALANKGSLLWIDKKDGKGAIDLYKAAFAQFPSWEYADKASNLCLHINQKDQAVSYADRALKRIKKHITYIKTKARMKPVQREQTLLNLEGSLFKVKIHVATCRLLSGRSEEAKKALEGMELGDAPLAAKYNLALLKAAQNDSYGCLVSLKAFMKTRRAAKARNQLRVFIRDEPVFQKFRAKKGFSTFLKDEPEES